MNHYLELRKISKRFGGVQALDSIDLTLERGEVHCLVGENGCGKSTLIKILSGVLRPDANGEILIEGEAKHHLDPVATTHLGIQVIYQDLSIFPNLTVAENIGIACHLGRPRIARVDLIRNAAETVLKRIGVQLDLDRLVGELSIADRQLVAICRALAADAKLVVMDEPTASLTRKEVDALMAVVRDMRSAGICVVFVSHRLDEIREVADRVTVIRDGRRVGTFKACDVNDDEIVHLMTGKSFSYTPATGHRPDAPVVLSTVGLTRLGEFADINLEVRAGEILGITGLLGAGRTELALTIFGIHKPDSGVIKIGGTPVRFKNNRDAIAAGVAYVPEDRLSLGLVMNQPISSNIVLTVLNELKNSFGFLSIRGRQALVRKWIGNLGIKVSDPENNVQTLSGGNQQRIVLSKWMARKPRLLILDSPTVGVDINAKDGIYAVMRELAAGGVAVIVISDELPEVLYHSHRILVMREGHLVSEHLPPTTTEAELKRSINA